MKTYQELEIKYKESPDLTLNEIQARLPTNWKRDFESEQNLFKMAGQRQACFNYIVGDITVAKLWIAEGPDCLRVTNIVPQIKSELKIDEYNEVVGLFAKVVSDAGLKFSLSKADCSLEDILSEESARKFRSFSRAANKSTGRSHPLDQKRWFSFIYSTLRNDEYIDLDSLQSFLMEDGWDSDTAQDLSLDYEYGYASMKFAAEEENDR